MKTVFLIVGRTGSGKDTIVNKIIENNSNYKKLVSYATRPKRDGESSNNHIFITSDKVSVYKPQMVAYTKIGEYEYFATYDQLKSSDFYIIDYEGVKYLKSNPIVDSTEVKFVTIYIKCSDTVRQNRALHLRNDDYNTFISRNENEENQFNEMVKNEDFDYVVTNDNLDTATHIIENIVFEEIIKNDEE